MQLQAIKDATRIKKNCLDEGFCTFLSDPGGWENLAAAQIKQHLSAMCGPSALSLSPSRQWVSFGSTSHALISLPKTPGHTSDSFSVKQEAGSHLVRGTRTSKHGSNGSFVEHILWETDVDLECGCTAGLNLNSWGSFWMKGSEYDSGWQGLIDVTPLELWGKDESNRELSWDTQRTLFSYNNRKHWPLDGNVQK